MERQMLFKSKYAVPGSHALVWGILLSIPYFLFHNVPENSGLPEHYFWITNLYHIALFYLNAYFLYPKLLNRKWWFLYPFAIVGVLLLSYLIKRFGLFWFEPSFQMTRFNRRVLIFPPVPFLIASIVYRFALNQIRSAQRERERRAEQLQAELMFLRSQISPHFLFNIITNLIALARQKSELLETYLVRFSELLRYMLYDSKEGKFSVNQEITYLQNYLEIQKLRFSDEVRVTFQLENNNGDCSIEPMLLIPFVENAFKHGGSADGQAYIDIRLEVIDGKLSFQVENNYRTGDTSKDKSKGIGIENVRNRLGLLYVDKYQLNITNQKGVHIIQLELDLSC